jgi:hypothetical protein
VQQFRIKKARVNHETYKQLYTALHDRIKRRASTNVTHLLYVVPPIVPGRPVYDPIHAARYITDKLRRGGFRVESAQGHVLFIDWTPRPAVLPLPSAPPPQHQPTQRHPELLDRNVINARLQALKRKLRG